MKRQSARPIRLVACVTLIQSAASAGAQEPNTAFPFGYIPIHVVVPERDSGPADRIQVTRSASDSGYVIFVPRTLATPAGIFAGARALRSALDRKAAATILDQPLSVSVAGAAASAFEAGVADRALARLRTSTPYVDATFGLVRSAVIYTRRPGVWRVVVGQRGLPQASPPPVYHHP